MAMSDDLIFRYVTSTSYPTFTCAACGVALCSHAEAVLSVLHETIPAERTILSDLIAELRRSAKGYLSPGAYAITVKEQLWLADWAEARLREVQGE